MKRRQFVLLLSLTGLLGIGGCSWWKSPDMRSQSPEEMVKDPEERSNKLVGDITQAYGKDWMRVEAVGLVNGLHDTGSDPSPGPARQALWEEMKKRGVENPNAVLTSGKVSLVFVEGYLRPGLQKGDRFDVQIRVPDQSDTTSLRGGFLLDTLLTDQEVIGKQLHHGNLWGNCKGPVLVDPAENEKADRVAQCRGRVLGSGVATQSRKLGLVLTDGHRSVMTSSRVAIAVNKRFHSFNKGVKELVANAERNDFIALKIHPRYKNNLDRYFLVVRRIAISETQQVRMNRIVDLETEVLNPESAEESAIQLEAVGTDGEKALCKALESKNTEVRFYAAEALAYLDRREAAEPLGQIARDEPAFRVRALGALSVMTDFIAEEKLRDLLSSPSAETRYGAFRALWTMNENAPLVKGEVLNGEFHYHALKVDGPPMVHVTRNRIPEVVLFGADQRLATPLAINAGNQIMVTSAGGDEISVAKYTVKDGDEKRVVSARLDDVIHAVAELGGTYPDVVQVLQEAKTANALASRLAVDALPEPFRTYDRVADKGDDADKDDDADKGDKENGRASVRREHPSPDLFCEEGGAAKKTRRDAASTSDEAAEDDAKDKDEEDSAEASGDQKGFFARLLGR